MGITAQYAINTKQKGNPRQSVERPGASDGGGWSLRGGAMLGLSDLNNGRTKMDIWRDHPDECDFCGSGTEIFTDERLPDGHGYDGDDMRCANTGCNAVGHWTVDEDGEAYACWDDDVEDEK